MEEDADNPVGVKIVKGEIVHVEKCDMYDSAAHAGQSSSLLMKLLGNVSSVRLR